ncbi:ABC transporter ATP-binding protein [Gaopeijia maritima]|uniref:ABC transporter ATP-binding protein n=1 Tax=Gaopeijia maritima TaxID=3119007 RepID=UPI00386CF725
MALDGARLDAFAGEVHALLGENGAGKTTLLSVLAGLVAPDAGSVRLDGVEVRARSPRQAWQQGIGMVHQHFALVDRMTVLENLALGRGGSGLRLDLAAIRREATALAASVRLEVDLDAPVEGLGVGERQRAEILKVLLRDPGVLVLDEPTAVLSPGEVQGLLALLRRLAAEGRAVVLVAHKLDEVLAVADRVTVLRRGRTVLEAARAEVDARALAAAMVGEEAVGDLVVAGSREASRPVGLADAPAPVAVLHDAGVGDRLAGVDLEIRPGEIVGIAGVEGNGQRALARLLAGRAAADRGRVEVPAEVAFIPQDRHREGLVGGFTLTENVALGLHRSPRFRRGPLLRWSALRRRTRELMERYRITAPGPRARASALSGGNQQRLVVARELEGDPALIVAENPTRGLDVAAAAFVHRVLRERVGAERAAAVVLISTDLDEILALADRVFVLVRGRLRPVPAEARTREGVGARMLDADGPGAGS